MSLGDIQDVGLNCFYLSGVSALHEEVLLFWQKDPKPFPLAHGPAGLLRPNTESHGCGTRFAQTVLAEKPIRRWDSAIRKAEHTDSKLRTIFLNRIHFFTVTPADVSRHPGCLVKSSLL